jgi:hypothetical protein
MPYEYSSYAIRILNVQAAALAFSIACIELYVLSLHVFIVYAAICCQLLLVFARRSSNSAHQQHDITTYTQKYSSNVQNCIQCVLRSMRAAVVVGVFFMRESLNSVSSSQKHTRDSLLLLLLLLQCNCLLLQWQSLLAVAAAAVVVH